MDFILFFLNLSLPFFRYKVVEDEYDNVVRSIPARDKKPKSESKLILQTTMSLAEIKALEWVEGVKVFFILKYFKSKSLLFN